MVAKNNYSGFTYNGIACSDIPDKATGLKSIIIYRLL